MRGFAILGGAYLLLWGLLLAPGAFVMARGRTRGVPIPADDPSGVAWIRRVQRAMLARAGTGEVAASEVPFQQPVTRRRGRTPVATAVLRVRGALTVPEGAEVPVGLIVSGDFVCEPGARLTGPVWSRGSVVLGERTWAAEAVIAEGDLFCDPGAHVQGGVAAIGAVELGEGAVVDGPATAREEIVLGPRTRVGAALAPLVRAAPVADPDLEVAPPSAAEPLEEVAWDDELDAALRELWPEGRLAEIVEALYERTGVAIRGVHLFRRARELGLYAKGLPRRPSVLGRKPAWVVSPEVVRVGADLRIPAGGTVSYTLLVEGALEVFQDAQIEAPARSGRGLLLRTGAVVYGQVASDGLIVCEEGTAILGPVDSSTHILLFANARIGTPGFGGAHAVGAIGLEPGAEILGGAVAGLGVRGEALRPEPERAESAKGVGRIRGEAVPEESGSELPVSDEPGKRRRRLRRARPRAEAVSEPPAPQEDEGGPQK
jgi:hypothetical protein